MTAQSLYSAIALGGLFGITMPARRRSPQTKASP